MSADAERLSIHFQEADAENLPFEDGTFDVVLSTFGVMFTPDQEKAAGEMLRVCKPGGKIGLANWTPQGYIGQVFKTLGTYLPPAPGVRWPAVWGMPERINELFNIEATSVSAQARHFNFRYRSPEHCLEVFGNFYGPILTRFGATTPVSPHMRTGPESTSG